MIGGNDWRNDWRKRLEEMIGETIGGNDWRK